MSENLNSKQKTLDPSDQSGAATTSMKSSEMIPSEASVKNLEFDVAALVRKLDHANQTILSMHERIEKLDADCTHLKIIMNSRPHQLAILASHCKQRPSLIALAPFKAIAILLGEPRKNKLLKAIGIYPYEKLSSALRFIPRRWYERVTRGWKKRIIENKVWSEGVPLVSVIIPCFNYGRYLPDALESVQKQSLKNYEIIVVEGGSTDSTTRSLVRSLDGKNKVRCVYQEKPSKVGINRLAGLRAARGKYIVFLDPDDKLEESYLEKAVFVLELSGKDVLTPNATVLQESSLTLRSTLAEKDKVWITLGLPVPDIFDHNLCSTISMFRHEFWKTEQIGYSETIELEDWDFWCRMASRGAKYAHLSEPSHLYRVHENSLTEAIQKNYQFHVEKIKEIWSQTRGDFEKLGRLYELQNESFSVKNAWANLSKAGLSYKKPEPRVRVMLCVPWFDRGGSTFLMKGVFAQLKQHHIEVVSVATETSFGPASSAGEASYQDFSIELVHLNNFAVENSNINDIRSEYLYYLTQSRQIDLIFIVGSRLAYEALPLIARKSPTTRVVDQLYNTEGHIANNQEFKKFIDYNIVANQAVKDKLLENGIEECNIELIPHGVDENKYSPNNPDFFKLMPLNPWGGETDRELESTEKKPNTDSTASGHDDIKTVFGFFGRLSEEKRPDYIIELARRIKCARFIIAGEGPMLESLSASISRYELSNRVKLVGFQDPLLFYKSVDCMIIPSRIEGLPLTLLESMSMELPSIATRVGMIGEVIENGINGFCVSPSNHDELYEAALTFTRLSVDARAQLGISARNTIISRFTLGACAQRYLKSFKSIGVTS